MFEGTTPTPRDRVRVGEAPDRLGENLSQALGYVAVWSGKRVVVKLGGRVLDQGGLGTLIEDLVLLQRAGLNPILVHGGGAEISRVLEQQGCQSQFSDGLRVTDAASMRVVEMVLAGRVNKDLVRRLQAHGAQAVGLSGRDGGLIRVEPHPRRELGFVGRIKSVQPAVLETLMGGGFLPVVATLGLGPEGESYNVNADTAAASLAVAVRAEKFIVLTDVAGILRPSTTPGGDAELLSEVTLESAKHLISENVISSGMIPKVEACLEAIRDGVPSSHIVSALQPHSLLVELFTEGGIGTIIRKPPDAD